MFRVKTILFTIYDLLCLYTATFCAYVSIRPVALILYKTDFADKMLEMNEWGPGFYIRMVIVGCICCILLCIAYHKQPKTFTALLVSLFIHPIVVITMGYSVPILIDLGDNSITETVVKYIYWFFIACTIAVIVYSIDILIKEIKLLKNRESDFIKTNK